MFEKALWKGKIAEDIVRRHLEGKGWNVFQPKTKGGHAFDMLCIKDKRHAFAADIKCKARMNFKPVTGVDANAMKVYRNFSVRHNMPFWLIFADEAEKRIYGNSIANLGIGQTMVTKQGAVFEYWPLADMVSIAEINDDDVFLMKDASQRGYGYA